MKEVKIFDFDEAMKILEKLMKESEDVLLRLKDENDKVNKDLT